MRDLSPCQTDSLRLLLIVPSFDQAEALEARMSHVPGHVQVLARGGLAARTAVSRLEPDVVLCHLDLVGDGPSSLPAAIERGESWSPVVVLVPEGREAEGVEAVNAGALSCLPLLPQEEQLSTVLARAVQCRSVLVAERRRSHLSLDQAELLARDSARLDEGLDQLYMAWQPIIEAQSGALFGYEALVRSDSEHTPTAWHLIDLANRLGRSMDLHMAVLRAVAADLDAGGLEGTICVNITLDCLMAGVHGTDADRLLGFAEGIVLEVNEEGHLASIPQVRAVTERVRATGYRLAMDDLGAGDDSLARILALDPDIYKLDRLAMSGCDRDPRKRRYIRSIVEMSLDEGATVVAEGIERPQEAQVARELGCDLLQGYLIARPRRRSHWLDHPLDTSGSFL